MEWTISLTKETVSEVMFQLCQDYGRHSYRGYCQQKSWTMEQHVNFKLPCGDVQMGSIQAATRSEQFEEKETDDNQNKVLYIIVSVIAVVLFLGGIVLAVALYLVKRKTNTKEEPKMEKNVYYGRDDDYYNETDNRIEDKNDYYDFD